MPASVPVRETCILGGKSSRGGIRYLQVPGSPLGNSAIGVGMILRPTSGPFLVVVLAHLFLFHSNVFAQRTLPFPPSEDFQVLAPKLQKELGKALQALQANNPPPPRAHLDPVYP